MIPTLPVRQVRSALDAGDWEAAASLISTHETELRDAIAAEGSSARTEPLLALLHAQRAFLEELKTARDDAAHQLQQLGRDHRGAQAYLGAGGG
ncbi:hypothetical protein [Lysobacter sp. D1-1-M9]|uniref:hypothetical protein n=1 Tax=Novilysobacter longmucuonensis TaxID=3098603 RepID=UPI002FCB353A